MSSPLPAAVAAALVLAIGLALTATVTSPPIGGRTLMAPPLAPSGTLAVEPAHQADPETATRERAPPAPVG